MISKHVLVIEGSNERTAIIGMRHTQTYTISKAILKRQRYYMSGPTLTQGQSLAFHLSLPKKSFYIQDENLQLSLAKVNNITPTKIRNPVYCSAFLFTAMYMLGSHFWTLPALSDHRSRAALYASKGRAVKSSRQFSTENRCNMAGISRAFP